MQTALVAEEQVLQELQALDRGKWPEVLDFIAYLKHRTTSKKTVQLHSRELTARDLLESDLVGLWTDRQDIGDSVSFARRLRDQAEHRWEPADAVG